MVRVRDTESRQQLLRLRRLGAMGTSMGPIVGRQKVLLWASLVVPRLRLARSCRANCAEFFIGDLPRPLEDVEGGCDIGEADSIEVKVGGGAQVKTVQSCIAPTTTADAPPLLGSEVVATGAVELQNASKAVGGGTHATIWGS